MSSFKKGLYVEITDDIGVHFFDFGEKVKLICREDFGWLAESDRGESYYITELEAKLIKPTNDES